MEQNRLLRSRWSRPGNFVHNGERGRVVEVHAGEAPVLVVDFERRGRVQIAERYLAKHIRPGVVGQIGHA